MTPKSEKATKNRKKPIPDFASYEEEAEFWDTHDLTEYWGEPVKLKVAKNLSKGITIRFDEETLEALREYAHEKGIGPTTLARMWIVERLQTVFHPHSRSSE